MTTITPWKGNAQAGLTLSFDGAYTTTFRMAIDVASKYKMPLTWYIVTDSIGKELEGRPVVSWEDLKKASTKGMEVASHTVSHPFMSLSFGAELIKYLRRINMKKIWKIIIPSKTLGAGADVLSSYKSKKNVQGVSSSGMILEAVNSKRIIEERIPDKEVLSFAYPGGRYTRKLKKSLKEADFLSARSTDSGYNSSDLNDFYSLKSKVWNINVDSEKANTWVDGAVRKNAWLIETYHVLSEDGATGYRLDTSIMNFENHLNYIASKNIWVDTQDNIIKYLIERNTTKIKVNTGPGGDATLSVKNNLDPAIYNQVLTLKIAVPDKWSKAEIIQGGEVREVSTVKENRQSYVYCNILPNKGDIRINKF